MLVAYSARPPRCRGGAGARPGPLQCTTLCNGEALAPFLAKLRASRRESRPPVHIIQIGDSHTAGDNITNGWRSRLQARHGFGGRGALAAGRPYPAISPGASPPRRPRGWSVNATFGGRWREGGPPLGISGFTQTASAAGQTIGVTADSPEQNFDRVILCAVAQPGGGTIQPAHGRRGASLEPRCAAPAAGLPCRRQRHVRSPPPRSPPRMTASSASPRSAPSGGAAASSSPISAWSAPSSPISGAPTMPSSAPSSPPTGPI